ncbi:hypothetical protein [Pseudomonas sp. TMW 2.1634]|uniref:hypothetical protein n=1 Tax=Pseudomonas sp. TMW 2.1634 TaxID=1886807 RepID=UPI000E736F91|nr:hypothetical protein [Pseudomonas sp. TMW 2.1634]AOA06649.1 hypothetical protein BFC21_12925 [Pseudomonas sp. TMW 2.1634]
MMTKLERIAYESRLKQEQYEKDKEDARIKAKKEADERVPITINQNYEKAQLEMKKLRPFLKSLRKLPTWDELQKEEGNNPA